MDLKSLTGWLDKDIDLIKENFYLVKQAVTLLHEKVDSVKKDLTNLFNSKLDNSNMLLGNMSLYNLEHTQKIKIGVKV